MTIEELQQKIRAKQIAIWDEEHEHGVRVRSLEQDLRDLRQQAGRVTVEAVNRALPPIKPLNL